jgi:hypothetical protein
VGGIHNSYSYPVVVEIGANDLGDWVAVAVAVAAVVGRWSEGGEFLSGVHETAAGVVI